MNHLINNEFFTLNVDPQDQWENITPQSLLEAGGFIPQWLLEYAETVNFCKEPPTLQEFMDKTYGFGLHRMTGGEVKKNLTYTYPEDPPMHPLFYFKCNHSEAEFVMWKHAICAMRQNKEDEWFVTRMD